MGRVRRYAQRQSAQRPYPRNEAGSPGRNSPEYPLGLAADKIPIIARIISVADTYDVMTSRDSYRRPVSSEAAIVELRRVAGAQLDPVVVEKFVEMVEAGRVEFRHADSADFELELAFERRVEAYARPRVAAAVAEDITVGTEPAMEGVVFGYALNISKCKGVRKCVEACVAAGGSAGGGPCGTTIGAGAISTS